MNRFEEKERRRILNIINKKVESLLKELIRDFNLNIEDRTLYEILFVITQLKKLKEEIWNYKK